MNPIEIAGLITGIIGVYLTAKAIIWCWPVALINVLIYLYIFYEAHLYSDAGLQIFYIGMAIFGWYNWRKRKNPKKELKISNSTSKELFFLFLLAIFIASLQGYVLHTFTNASFPYIDSFCTAGSLVGTFLQTKKKIENWIIWIFIDLIYVYIFIQKNLYPTAFLYLIFVGLAVYGYLNWRKEKALLVLE